MDTSQHFHYHKRRINDRYDGWRVRKVDAVFAVIPFFLRTRLDSQNFFEERIYIDHLEKFIRDNKEEMPDLNLMHIIMAALVRLTSQRPRLNRFVMWNKIFARNHFNMSIVVKRQMTQDGEETLVKPYFQMTDTLQDVMRRTNGEIVKNKEEKNGSDKTSNFFGYLPPFLVRFAVSSLMWLDNVGIMPKFINTVSPWHCSIFLTNLGSIGIESIYHHLYEFGTCSMFVSMGKKTRTDVTDKNGNVKRKTSILLRFVVDERICDGFYYASGLRDLNHLLANPQLLLTPPKKVVIDDGVVR